MDCLGRTTDDAALGFESIKLWLSWRVEQQILPTPNTSPARWERGVKIRLKADKTTGRIESNAANVLENTLSEVWDYQLGHRSALEWILKKYKKTTTRDLTIGEKFASYCSADHEEKVIDLLMRVCWVSVETVEIIAAIENSASCRVKR
jgi:predicted helicase